MPERCDAFRAPGVMDRRRLLAAALAATALPGAAAERSSLPRSKTGLWLRIDEKQGLDGAIDLLRRRNERYTGAGRKAPWVGLLFSQTWGQIELAAGKLDLGPVRQVLDRAQAAGFGVVVQVSDKAWQYKAGDVGYAPAVPQDLDKGAVDRDRFEGCEGGVCQDAVRYASMQDMTKKGRKGDAVRKYVAKRWKLEDRWFAMWIALGQGIGQHPALAAVLTPESALALPDRSALDRVGYPGGDWFIQFLLTQARTMRRAFRPEVQVVSNINLVPPDNARNLPRVVEQLQREDLSIWAQDLNPGGGAYRSLYPLLDRFPVERRWAMVTNTSTVGPAEMIRFAQSLGIGNLAFLSHRFEDQLKAVEQIPDGQATFLPK
jgi:hypothetical protein